MGAGRWKTRRSERGTSNHPGTYDLLHVVRQESGPGSRRGSPRPGAAGANLGSPLREREFHVAPFPRRNRGAGRGNGMLLGRRAALLADPGRVHHGSGVCGRFDPQSDLRGDLHRPNRSCRGGADRVRLAHGRSAGPAQDLLGEPRPDPGHAPGQRCRDPVPVGPLSDHRRADGHGARLPGPVSASAARCGLR